jgi:hypothetical protein
VVSIMPVTSVRIVTAPYRQQHIQQYYVFVIPIEHHLGNLTGKIKSHLIGIACV